MRFVSKIREEKDASFVHLLIEIAELLNGTNCLYYKKFVPSNSSAMYKTRAKGTQKSCKLEVC